MRNFGLNLPGIFFISFKEPDLMPINKQIKLNIRNPILLIGKNKFQKQRNNILVIKPSKMFSFNLILFLFVLEKNKGYKENPIV